MGWLLRKPSAAWLRQPCQPQSVPYKSQAVMNQTMQTCPTEAIADNRAQTKRLLKSYRLTVVLPVYNEQACLNATFDAVLEYARDHPDYQFTFVNDGSIDRTQELLEKRLARCQTGQITLVSYPLCRGKGHAVKTGIASADSDYVCFLDSDLAYSLDHIDRLLEKLKEADVVIGCRQLAPDGAKGLHPTRKIAGRVFNVLSQWILKLRFSDMQAGVKGFRVQAARAVFAKQGLTGFSFDVELLYLAQKQGLKIVEIPAQVSLQHATKASKVHLLKDSLKMLLDLFRIRYYDSTQRYD